MAALLGRFRVSRPKPITTAPAPDPTSTQFVFHAFEVETKPPTARQTMLPNAKTRRVHAGDPSAEGHKEGEDIGAGAITHHPPCPHLLDRHATADNKRANAASGKRAGSTPLPLLLSDSAYAHVWLPIPFFLLPFT
ncbi:hypothetical protein B0H14DRAFT_3539866 [Mycena olivaceomarginata]|nr:hypothetical protein B0H14DRAFT_3539866 [Mycena olivaceomarginata]